MKNKSKMIGILVIVFAVLLILYNVVNTRKKEVDVPETTQTIFSVTSFPSSNITKLEYTIDSEVNTFSYKDNAWVLENSTLVINPKPVIMSAGLVANLSSYEKLDETTSDFGTKNSTTKVIATLNDDSVITITIGDKTPDSAFYYFKAEGTTNDGIYTLPVISADTLMVTKNDVANKAIAQIEFETMSKIVINQRDYQNLVLELPTSEEQKQISENYQGVSTLIMQSPYKNKTIFMQNFVDNVFSTITTLAFGDLVKSDCTDLSKYGLAEPFITINIVSNNGEINLQVGDMADDTNYYVKNTNDNHVFLMSKDLLAPFIDVDCFKFMNRFIALIPVDKVESVNIQKDDYEYELKENSINGIPIDSTQFSDLYKKIVSLEIDNYTNAMFDIANYDFILTYNLKDGTKQEYKFSSTDIGYLYFDDEADMYAYVGKSQIDNILDTAYSLIK